MNANRSILLAILVKDKAHCLTKYLQCIEAQTVDKKLIHLYIRSNNNTDNTLELLNAWLAKVSPLYASVTVDTSNVPERVQDLKPHDWTAMRFQVLGKIRQASITKALELGADYFVVDCDNFIVPETLQTLRDTGLNAVAPYLKCSGYKQTPYYSNYHFLVGPDGYFKESPEYYTVQSQKIKGLIEVGVIHCTYLLRHEILSQIQYLDQTQRHEYVIMSEKLRKASIPQYLDNRKVYGYVTFADTVEELKNEFWFKNFGTTK
jgi:hypothetical protein